MFGYCKCDREEIKVKDLRLYSAYYCTLCHALGKEFGLFYRLILSHDATFILICLDGISPLKIPSSSFCPLNPLHRKRLQINDIALQYAAFLNYILFLQKLQDNIRDEKSPIKRTLSKSLFFFASKNYRYIKDLKKFVSCLSVTASE